ncbi:hypothetical protein KY285_003259 [Solanum tuberosum]|nr:hypothetical protein KY284_003429 [Solanum tuberosum]KAH0732328.1 hypothetical protein KY289_003516 [Solanum tuberosum]KAH0767388.1 hypothetical protein KY285_003259 [Solanum tuberosum]
MPILPTLQNIATAKASATASTALFKEADYMYDHRAMQTFWIPYDDIVSDEDATNIISKLICLMNVIPMLDEQCIMNFARSMKECPSNEDHWYMTLGITKVTYLPHENFINLYNKMGQDYNWNAWKRTQEVLDSRIAAFELLKKIGIKKMRFRASEFKDCNLLDTCSICRDGFLEGIDLVLIVDPS